MALNSKTKKRKKTSPELKQQPLEAPQAAPVEQSDDFSKVVQESKNRLHAEQNKPLKRGRGRPSTVKPTETSSSPNFSSVGSPTSPNQLPAQQMNIGPMIEGPLKLLSGIPAKKYKCEDLTLSDEEAQQCGKAVNDLLNAFIPDMSQMSPKTAAVFGAVMIFGSVGMNKAIILANHREKFKDEIKAQEAEINKQPAEPSINAAQAFQQPRHGMYPTASV